MSSYYGNNNGASLTSSNWNYSWDHFQMGNGNDTVITPNTGTAYSFYGLSGNDHFVGDTNNDVAYGGHGTDNLSGWSGNDRLFGEADNDFLDGGSGSDQLTGGLGADNLTGGSGSDTFYFVKGDSQAHVGQADTITDWDVAHDWIDSSIRGTSSNYAEGSTVATNIEDARYQVEHSATMKEMDHVFLYNARTDTGYLLSDLNRNYVFETGVVMQHAGSASDLSYSDII